MNYWHASDGNNGRWSVKTGEKIKITGETNVKFWANHRWKFQNSLILFLSRNNKDQYFAKMALKWLVYKSKIQNFPGLRPETQILQL